MIIIPVIALIIGIVVALVLGVPVSGSFGNYLSVAALAGMDTIIGGIRAAMEGIFDNRIFVSGFLINAVTAALLAYCGDQIGIDLFLAAVVVLGGRIFVNLSIIRRHFITRVEQRREREALSTQAQQ
jgi:small basic protein